MSSFSSKLAMPPMGFTAPDRVITLPFRETVMLPLTPLAFTPLILVTTWLAPWVVRVTLPPLWGTS